MNATDWKRYADVCTDGDLLSTVALTEREILKCNFDILITTTTSAHPLHIPLMWLLYVAMLSFDGKSSASPQSNANPELRVAIHAFPDLFAIAVYYFITIPACGDLIAAFFNLQASRGLPIEYLLLYFELFSPPARDLRMHSTISVVTQWSETLKRLLGIQGLLATGHNVTHRSYSLPLVTHLLRLASVTTLVISRSRRMRPYPPPRVLAVLLPPSPVPAHPSIGPRWLTEFYSFTEFRPKFMGTDLPFGLHSQLILPETFAGDLYTELFTCYVYEVVVGFASYLLEIPQAPLACTQRSRGGDHVTSKEFFPAVQ